MLATRRLGLAWAFAVGVPVGAVSAFVVLYFYGRLQPISEDKAGPSV